MSRALIGILEKLLTSVDDIRASAFTPAQRRALDDFARRTGSVLLTPKGGGAVYRVVKRELVEAQLRSLRPHDPGQLPNDLPRRAANLAVRRDSKAFQPAHESSYVLLKAVGSDVIWENGDQVFDLSAATRTAGVGALAIRAEDTWRSAHPLWLVENQAPFDIMDWLPPDSTATLLYYAGQLPERVVEWLARGHRATEIIHFPDYDGVGLQNYVRLLERGVANCHFWMIPQWRALLTRYGSDALWQKTQPQFASAVAQLERLQVPREVLELCATMSREGKALEHEAVWLGSAALFGVAGDGVEG